MTSPVSRPRLPARARLPLAVCGLLGVGAFAASLATEPARAWSAYLASAFFTLTIALGAAVFLAMNYVANAGWHTIVKRVPEALTTYLPVGALTIFGALGGAHTLYHWTHADAVAHDPVLLGKSAYLNLPFFAIRMGVFLGLWTLFAYLLRRNSRLQDADGDLVHTRRNKRVSAAFLIVFALTFSFASFDWLMSTEPHWFSTIYGFYNIAGVLVAGVAATTILCIALRRRGRLPGFNEHHLHDLSKLLFGFSTFWAYLWLSQYLLIWYANIPEETSHVAARIGGGWGFLFWMNPFLGFAIPFVGLLPRAWKRLETHVLWVAGSVLLGRWLDVYLMVGPSVMPQHGGIGWSEIGVLLGFAALFGAWVTRNLLAVPLVARRDPYLGEALRLHS